MSDRLNAIYSLIEKLKNDYRDNDKRIFHIHPSIKFELMEGTGGICIRANKPIKTQEIIMIIPEAAQTTTKNIATRTRKNLTTLVKQVNNKLVNILPHKHEIEEHLLAFVVMYLSSNLNNNSNNNDTKCIFKKHMACMPSHKELRNDMQMCLYWTKEQLNVLGDPNSYVRRQIEMRQETVKLAFHGAIYPVLKAQSSNIQAHFIMASVSKCCSDFKSTKECLWESYLASFTICHSRTHGIHGLISPEIIPLVDLFNGVSDWSLDADDHVRCNVDLQFNPNFMKSRLVYTQRDIKAGEELLITYGNQSPGQFLTSYGTIPRNLFHVKKPEQIGLLCPPHMIPKDLKRILLLQNDGYPLKALGNQYIGILHADSYFENEEGIDNGELIETEDVVHLAHFLWMVSIASDKEIDISLKTGRIPASSSNDEICRALCQVIDYNVTLLQDASTGVSLSSFSTEQDYERANRNDIPLWEKYALHSRICQKQTLFMWRDHFCRRFDITPDFYESRS